MRSELPMLLVSELPPAEVDLTPGQWWSLACPDCGRWRNIYRLQRIAWHRPDPDDRAGPECRSSRRNVRVDLTPQQWQDLNWEATASADGLRAGARPIPRMPDRLAS